MTYFEKCGYTFPKAGHFPLQFLEQLRKIRNCIQSFPEFKKTWLFHNEGDKIKDGMNALKMRVHIIKNKTTDLTYNFNLPPSQDVIE